MPVRIACAQLNQTIGDFDGNAARIEAAAAQAVAQGARVLLTPELATCGYPPEDLLLREAFYAKADAVVARLLAASRAWPRLLLVVGAPLRENGQRYNAALAIQAGTLLGTYRKRELPNYGVFDEARYFVPADDCLCLDVDGVRMAVAICEDFWFERVPLAARAAGAEVLLVPNASPFHVDKRSERFDVGRRNVSRQSLALVTCNLVGGQDELVFDGQSFALDASGALRAQARSFQEDLLLVDVTKGEDGVTISGPIEAAQDRLVEIYSALRLGVQDYVGKNGFPGVILGLSGGIDSALTLAIAVDALGPERVRTVMMPSVYTADMSQDDASEVARRLGVRYDVWPIAGCFEAFKATLADEFRGLPEDATEENIQARVRGTLLMALSNKSGAIVLTTGNKSEMAVGYCTLYGDMAGGFAVLKDVPKTVVFALSRWRNTLSEVIPERIITRPPSAELRADQTDQDSLPPYDVLDAVVRMYMEQDWPVERIVASGLPRPAVEQVVRLIRINEYKRRQAPVGVRITERAFGRDWRYPITMKFRE